MSFEIPYLEDEYIENTTVDLLAKYHPSRIIPIPIERIVEIGLRVVIYPFPGLHNNHRLNALLTGDRKVIFVDEKQYRQYVEKSRFSIAHEVGHYVLHWKYHEDLPYTYVDEYIAWRPTLPRKVVDRFETQSHIFAGFLLMPTDELVQACNQVVGEHEADLKYSSGVDPWPYIANDIARIFEVSPPAALIRIRNGNIPSLVRLPR